MAQLLDFAPVLPVPGLSPARLLDPVCVLFCVLGVALVLSGRAVLRHSSRRVRIAGRAGLGAWGALWLLSLPMVSDWLCQQIEAPRTDPVPALAAAPEARRAIVVLSGGMRGEEGDGMMAMGQVTAARVMGAAELYHRVPVAYVICSGTDLSRSERAMSEAMALALVRLGVPQDRILLEPWSRDTRENAIYSAMMIRGLPVDVVAVVTSAVHLPRAQRDFRAQGLEVVPAPTDRLGHGASGMGALLPSSGALLRTHQVTHEVLARWEPSWAAPSPRWDGALPPDWEEDRPPRPALP